MEWSFINVITYFMIYSFGGWALESLYRSFCEKRWINTGFLCGPFCPIYGVGAILMLLFLKGLNGNIFALFISAFILLSTWEYIVGICLEKVFKTRYWDYSDHKINIQGRVCLFNSVAWGVLGTLFVMYIHPFIVEKIVLLNPSILKITVYICFIIFLVDTIISVVKTKNIKETLAKIEELNNQIREKIEELNKGDLKKDILENLQKRLYVLNKRKNRIIKHMYKRVYRLKKAFPELQSKEFTEILNKGIELIKKEKK